MSGQNRQWSLDDCIDFALKNNIDIKARELNLSTSKILKTQAKMNYIPSLDFNAGYQFNIGRSLDPTTYEFIENTKASSFNTSLNFGTTVFDGMKRYNNFKKTVADLEISLADLESVKKDITLSVTMGYMNILLNREIITSVKRQIEISENNIRRAKRLFEEGAYTEEKMQSLLVQRDNELYSLAESEGSLKAAIISLCSILNFRDYDSFEIKEDTAFVINDAVAISDALANVGLMPQMQSAKGKVKSAEYTLKITQGGLLPTVSLNAAMASSFSDTRRRPLLDESGNPVLSETGSLLYRNYPFFNQLNDNRNSYIGLSFNMPFLAMFQTGKNIAIARNNIQTAHYEVEATEKKLRETIHSLYVEIETARKKYEAAISSVEGNKIVFS
jgi:outer membrane protein